MNFFENSSFFAAYETPAGEHLYLEDGAAERTANVGM